MVDSNRKCHTPSESYSLLAIFLKKSLVTPKFSIMHLRALFIPHAVAGDTNPKRQRGLQIRIPR